MDIEGKQKEKKILSNWSMKKKKKKKRKTEKKKIHANW